MNAITATAGYGYSGKQSSIVNLIELLFLVPCFTTLSKMQAILQ